VRRPRQAGCLILVPGSGKYSAPAATASWQLPLVVAAVTGARTDAWVRRALSRLRNVVT